MTAAPDTRKQYDFKGISDAELERGAEQAHRSGVFKTKLRTAVFGGMLAGMMLFMVQAATLFGTAEGVAAIFGTGTASFCGLLAGRQSIEKKLDKRFFAWEGALRQELEDRKQLRARQTYDKHQATQKAWEAYFKAQEDANNAYLKNKAANDSARGFNVASAKPVTALKPVRFQTSKPRKTFNA